MIIGDVSWIAVIVATVISIVLGFLWYSQVLFGKQWQAEHGWSDAEINKKKERMGSTYGIMMLGSLIGAYILAQVVQLSGAGTAGAGIAVGFWMWFGFVLTTQLSKVLWEGKSWKLLGIDTAYSLVSFALMGAVLAVM